MFHFIGAEHYPTATVIDYEEFNKTVTIKRGEDYYKMLIDTIDDDIVEPAIKYFDIQIDENSLPDGVLVGRIGTTRINIMDDDGNHFLLYSYIIMSMLCWLYNLLNNKHATSW